MPSSSDLFPSNRKLNIYFTATMLLFYIEPMRKIILNLVAFRKLYRPKFQKRRYCRPPSQKFIPAIYMKLELPQVALYSYQVY
jgi:hypothetical protein